MKKNNAGMSIVEVVIMVAIIAILSGTGIYGLGQLGGFRAREGADSIASSLTEARITMLGKAKSNGNIAWEIYNDDGRCYVRTVYNVGSGEYYSDAKAIVDAKVKVTFGTGTLDSSNNSVNASGTPTELQDGYAYRIYFNRSTGALCDSDGSEISNDQYFRVAQGSKDYDVFIVAKTGKIITQSIKK